MRHTNSKVKTKDRAIEAFKSGFCIGMLFMFILVVVYKHLGL